MKKVKHCVLVGTRPEIIKLSVLIKLLRKKQSENEIEFVLVHSGQHYSHSLDSMFFQQLSLPEPKYNLSVGSLPHAKQIAKILESFDEILKEEVPDVVYVQGDTNTVFAGALAASRRKVTVAHIEAGLRSYDKKMPEETNRIMTDHISNLHFVPTNTQKELLCKENITGDSVHIVGNTIYDAVLNLCPIAQEKSKILEKYVLS